MDIGSAIKAGLNRKEWSQRQLAKEMGVSATTVSQWIKGQVTPPGTTLLVLIKKLDLIGDLFPEYVLKDRLEVPPGANVNMEKINDVDYIDYLWLKYHKEKIEERYKDLLGSVSEFEKKYEEIKKNIEEMQETKVGK